MKTIINATFESVFYLIFIIIIIIIIIYFILNEFKSQLYKLFNKNKKGIVKYIPVKRNSSVYGFDIIDENKQVIFRSKAYKTGLGLISEINNFKNNLESITAIEQEVFDDYLVTTFYLDGQFVGYSSFYKNENLIIDKIINSKEAKQNDLVVIKNDYEKYSNNLSSVKTKLNEVKNNDQIYYEINCNNILFKTIVLNKKVNNKDFIHKINELIDKQSYILLKEKVGIILMIVDADNNPLAFSKYFSSLEELNENFK